MRAVAGLFYYITMWSMLVISERTEKRRRKKQKLCWKMFEVSVSQSLQRPYLEWASFMLHCGTNITIKPLPIKEKTAAATEPIAVLWALLYRAWATQHCAILDLEHAQGNVSLLNMLVSRLSLRSLCFCWGRGIQLKPILRAVCASVCLSVQVCMSS